MKKAAIIITVILSSITNIIISPILFLLGALQSAYFSGMMGTTVHATLVLIGISLAVTAIPALIFSIIGAVKRKGVTDLILLAITLFIALALVCSGIALEVVLGIFNGDIGVIERVNSAAENLEIRFDERHVVYEFNMLEELEMAYAITVHKSQGSEYPIVILPMGSAPPMLLSRNLFYTAVTRAQSMVILVGREGILRAMVENNRQSMRYTGLVRWLEEKV